MNQRHPHSRSAPVVAIVLFLGALAGLSPCGEAAPETPAAAQQPGAQARPLYRVGVGDRLDIYVVEENTHTECLVRPDGRITFPLVGDVEAEGQTPPDLAARIRAGLEPYQKQPTVTVAVREINSYRVYVLGNVNTQGMIQSPAPLRVLQALATAGGLNQFAKKELVVIRNRKGAPPMRIPIAYTKIVSGENPESNIQLEAGDVVVVE
jgi:polysaccharide export outer membrane protein